jgi:hypothetical protein
VDIFRFRFGIRGMGVGVYQVLTVGFPLTPALSPKGERGRLGWAGVMGRDAAGPLAQNRGEA